LVDELGRRTESVYDYSGYGRLQQIVLPDPDGAAGSQTSPITKYQYDAVGNIVEIIDPRNFTTSRAYDKRNRIVEETDGAGSVRRSIYDAAGQMVAVIDPRGFAAHAHYDDRGRVILERLTATCEAVACRRSTFSPKRVLSWWRKRRAGGRVA
jgi:YD repeat-containing protein